MSLLEVIHRPQAEASAKSKPVKRARVRKPLPVPMLAMGTMVVFSVGFGAGSIAQFDHDWRTGTPQAVETVTGTIPVGSDLSTAIETLLAKSALPVTSVECGPVAAVNAAGAGSTSVGVSGMQSQLCRGRAEDGMVNIVAETIGQAVTLTVFSAK
ncbi:MAG: hypothetical protein ACOYEV_07535 [Candidatus Nanopelagicales bacterium]